MIRWLLLRLLWLVAMLFGITAVTFAVLDLAPVDRAELEAAARAESGTLTEPGSREAAIGRLRLRYGLVDADTLAPAPLWRRYGTWLGRAMTLRLAGPNEDPAAFWRRLARALPVTLLLGGLALLVAFGLGLPLGAAAGMRAGSRLDRALSAGAFVLAGVPEFLLATLLVLAFGGAWLQWLPPAGLQSRGAEHWPLWRQATDLGWHLLLPVAVLAAGPLVLVVRFVRDGVARAAAAPFAQTLRALGLEPPLVRRRLLRNALAPVATLTGSLLPLLVGGSIVVENVFALDGMGRLAFTAVLRQDQAMVMAVVLLTSVTTLLALLLSDLLHAWADPRVRLAR
ncbi:MAG: ABC transporter permease [Planctomycetes bacterium]|nr:ABC transporter permease [Planctomycetota bacterium]